MNDVRETINTMLVKTFHEILELEEKAIITDEFSDISNNDMHIIEAIGLGDGARMSVVAKAAEYHCRFSHNIHEQSGE